MNTKDILEALTGADILRAIHPSANKGPIKEGYEGLSNHKSAKRELFIDGEFYIVSVKVKE